MDDISYALTKQSFLNNVAKSKQSFASEVFDGVWEYLSSNKFRELIYIILQVVTLIMKIPWIQVHFPPAIIISKIISYIMHLVKPLNSLETINTNDLPSADIIAEAIKADLIKEQKQI